MAHVMETRATYDDMLKYGYEDIVVTATKEQSALMQRLETITDTKHFGGKSITFGVLYNHQGGVSSAGEGDPLPASLPGNFDNAVIPIDYHYFSIAVSGQVILTSQNPQDAFAQAWTQATQIRTRGFRQMMNREFCGDGLAILAQVDGAVAGQVITVDNASGWSGFNSSDVNGARHFTKNQYIQVRDSAGAAEDAGLKISSVSTVGAFPSTSAKLTVVGTITSVADGSYIYQAMSSTASNDAYGHESPGLKLLIDDGTVASVVQSIDGTTNPEWNSIVKYGSSSGTAEAVTPLRLMELISEVQMIGGGKIDYAFTSPAVALALGQIADENDQIVNAKTVELGYPSFTIQGVPVFQDPYMADEIYFVDKRALAMYQPTPPGWIDPKGDGSYISQVTGTGVTYHQMQATWYWFVTLGIRNRKWCGKMVDITVNHNWKL